MSRLNESQLPYPLWNIYRIVLIYALFMVCRIVFTLYNLSAFGEFEGSEIWDLVVGGLRFDTISIAYAFSLWALMAFLPLKIRSERWYRNAMFGCYMVVVAICVAVNFADAIYFRYVQKRFTAEEIFFADNSNSLQLIGKFAIENLHLVAIGIALILVVGWAYRRNKVPMVLLRGIYYYIGSLLLLLVVVAIAIGGIRGGWTRMARPTAIPYSLKFARTGAKANIVLSNPFCIIRTAGDSKVAVPQYFDEAELSQIYQPYHYPAPSDDGSSFYGTERPNIVVMVLESMSAEHSALLRPDIYSREGEPKEGYTPFLDSLMQHSLCFERMYANGKRSIQALPSVWASIPSLDKPFVLMSESLGESRPLPKIVADEGYSTTFFCGSERGSMGFDAYALSAGFTRCVSKEDYEARYGTDDFDGYWGIWDHRFIDFMGEEIGQMQEPFLASIFTTTSHHPFVTPDDWKAILPQGKTPMQPCAAYLDRTLRNWFEKYRSEEWFKRTIFLFVADHVSCERYDELTQLSPGDLHVIGFIYKGDGSLQGRYTAPASQIDLMPTLLGLMGYAKPYFAYGRDLNSESRFKEVVVWDNELFKAFDESYSYIFNNDKIEEVRTADGSQIATEQPDSAALAQTEQRIKAYIQQYYRHIEQKSYVVR
ncbi:MAG: LTA synthase family protein [Alistipes sp.]|nr:LTA synthase family protein [Alistipes sp.]